MSFFGVDSEVTNPMTSDLVGNGYSITSLGTIGATDADITNLNVINQTIVNETVNNFDVTNVNTSNIYTTEITIGDSGVWDSDGNGGLVYSAPDNDATITTQALPSPTLTTANAGNFQYTIANSDAYIADAVVSVWGPGNQWGAGSALVTTYDFNILQYTITSPTPGLENFGQSVYMQPDGTGILVGTGTGNVNAGAEGVYVFDYLPSSSPIYTQKIGTGLQNPVCCVLNDNPTRATVAIVAGGHLGSGGGNMQIWKWNGSLYALDQSLTLPQGGDGVYAPPMNGYAMKKMDNGGFIVSNLNCYASQNATGYKVFKYDVSGASYVLSETINVPYVATDINYGALESNGKDIIVVSFNSSAGNGRTLTYKNTTTSPYALVQTINKSGYVSFPKQSYGTIMIIAEKVDAGLALGQYYIHLYTGADATYTLKTTITAPTNTLSASIGAGGLVSTTLGDGLAYLYLGYGKEPIGGGGTSSGTNSIVSRYTLAYYGAAVTINGPLRGDLFISQTTLTPGAGVVQLQESQLGKGFMVSVGAGPFPTIYLPFGSRNGSWVMFQQIGATSCQIIDQYNNVIGTTSQNQWKRVIYNAVNGTWSMDGSNFSNPLNENIVGGGVYGIVGANAVEGLTVKTDTITLTPASLLTSIQVNENLRMATTKVVEFSGDIELKHVGAGTAVKIDSIPANVKPYVVGYDTTTKALSYFTTPSGGGGMITSVGGGANITVDNITNPAIPTVSLSSPLTANLNVGTQDITTSVLNADIDITTNGTGGVHIVQAGVSANGAVRIIQTGSGTIANPALRLVNQNASGSVGLEIYKNNPNPGSTGEVLHTQSVFGKDSTNAKQEYTRISHTIRQADVGTEDGSIEFGCFTNGTFQNYIQLNGNDVPSGEVNILKPLDLGQGSSGQIKTSVPNQNINISSDGLGYVALNSASGQVQLNGGNSVIAKGVNGVHLQTGLGVDKLKVLPTAVELAGVPLDAKGQRVKSSSGSFLVGDGDISVDTRISGLGVSLIAGTNDVANRFLECFNTADVYIYRRTNFTDTTGAGQPAVFEVVNSPFRSLQISGLPIAPSSGISDGSTTGSAGQYLSATGGGQVQWQTLSSAPTWFPIAPSAPGGSLDMNNNNLSNVANFSWGASGGTTEYLGTTTGGAPGSLVASIPIIIGGITYYIPLYQ